MQGTVLVAYASKYGATRDIAEAIGRTLREAGLTVDLRECRDVKSLDGYVAVVLGSAVYVGRWRREAADLLRNGEAQLAKLPVWLFSSGPTGDGDAEELLHGWHFPAALEPIAERIEPRDIVVFSGALDASALRGFDAFLARSVKAPVGDYRDLYAVSDWARGIAQALGAERATVPA
ncbi:MAG: flavodoxin domain-containing protein [Deinococcales bacterium]